MVSDSSCVLPAVSAVHFLCRALSHSAYIRSGNYWITQRCASRQTTSTLRPLYRRGGFVKRLWLFFFALHAQRRFLTPHRLWRTRSLRLADCAIHRFAHDCSFSEV